MAKIGAMVAARARLGPRLNASIACMVIESLAYQAIFKLSPDVKTRAFSKRVLVLLGGQSETSSLKFADFQDYGEDMLNQVRMSEFTELAESHFFTLR